MAAAADDQQTWADGTFEWNVEEDEFDNYVVEPNDVFAPTKVADALGNEMSAGDYTLVYFKMAGTEPATTDAIVGTTATSGDSMTGVAGGMPTEEGKYFVAVVKTPLPEKLVPADGQTWDDWDATIYKTQAFEVKAAKKSLEGAYAVEGDDANDTSFMYTGKNLEIAFAIDGKIVDPQYYEVSWVSDNPASGTETAAGSYEATLVGKGDYAGSRATVKFEVAKIDLSTAVLSMDYVEKVPGLTFDNATDGKLTPGNPNPVLKVNGEEVASTLFGLSALSFTDAEGVVHDDVAGLKGSQTAARDYLVKATPAQLNAAKNASIEGDYATFHAVVVEKLANVTYDEEQLFADGEVFNAAKNEKFDLALIAADVDGKAVAHTATVTKDGEEVTSFDEPGEYVLTVDVKAPASLAYGAHKVVTFTVVSKYLGNTTVYAAVDGKSVNGNEFPYTGSAIAPTVVVKTSNATLAVGEDYAVSYEDKATGEAVESIVEPGTYVGTVSYLGAFDKSTSQEKADDTFEVVVCKAEVKSGKSAQDVYAYTGEAVSPSFVAYTGEDLDGMSVELTAETAGVRYFKAQWSDADKAWERTDNEVAAASLTEEGHYFADVTVPSSDPHFEGTVENILIEISKTAGYNDVAADAWYADSVYKAKENGYMQGVAEGIFAPEQAMTRAEFAKLVANMAGYDYDTTFGVTYPTQFTDVPADAWFAGAVEWAARYGIVTGTSETTFEPNGTVTREQIATMLYRYAGNGAQADASALDAFVDGAQVSDWAENAMAWAVENGYMNGKGANDLQPQATATRAEIAALAVRVQPEAL